MFCKYCGGELEAGNPICPGCGKDTGEQKAQTVFEEQISTEAEKLAGGSDLIEDAAEVPAAPEKKLGRRAKLGLAIAGGVLALLAVAAGVWYLIFDGWLPRENDVGYRDSYSVSDEKAADKADTVVAVMGDKELNNGTLQVFYWMQFYGFVEDYADYLGTPYGEALGVSLNLDLGKPLDEQTLSGTDTTWQQYFLDVALQTWRQYQALCISAEKAGFQMEQEYRDYLDGLPAELEKKAQKAGYASADEMLHEEMGAGCTIADYMRYLELYYYGFQYFNSKYETFAPTEEEIRSFFTEHTEEFAEQGIAMDDSRLVDVRHILVIPEGGENDETGKMVYTDEAWEACRVKAQVILDTFLAGEATPENFGKLAQEQSEDPGSVGKGGLYQYVDKGDMVQAFDEWCFQKERQPGDTGLVRTPIGYHVMFFEGSTPKWYVYGENSLKSEMSNDFLKQNTEKYAADVNYKVIVLGEVEFYN